jgi:hypothetical protein
MALWHCSETKPENRSNPHETPEFDLKCNTIVNMAWALEHNKINSNGIMGINCHRGLGATRKEIMIYRVTIILCELFHCLQLESHNLSQTLTLFIVELSVAPCNRTRAF